MKINFRKIPFLISVTLLFVAVFAFSAIYMKTAENNREAEELIGQWRVELDRREEIKSLERSIQMFDVEMKSLDTHFAYGQDVVPFLNTVESLARATGADPEILSVATSEEEEILIVRMSAEGSFESLYKFLKLLENSPYELRFALVDLSSKDGPNGVRSGSWQLMLNFKLLTFIR
ncbi:MAG: hypothetical protein WD991_00070 [Candidatus Paceibacterota bacterium]